MTRTLPLALLMSALAAAPATAGGTVTSCTEQDLVNALPSGGIVRFACSGTIRVTQMIHLPQSVEIDGAGQVSLQSDPNVGIFGADTPDSRVVLRNLRLGGGRNVPFGSIFSGSGATLELYGVTVDSAGSSSGTVFGFVGGIVIHANRIVAQRSRFTNTTGTVLLAPVQEILDSEFRDNAGQPFMPPINQGGSARIERTTFSNNGVSAWRGDLVIRNSTFAGHGPRAGNGGALIVEGKGTIEKTSFLNNRADNGAAIWFSGTSLTVRRGVFEGNIATGVGGAIGVADEGEADLTITHSHFRNNSARQGGAIMLAQTPGPAIMQGSGHLRRLRGLAVNWARNQASEDGGAIYAARGDIDLNRVVFVDNTAGAKGGAIHGGTTSVDRTRLSNAYMIRNGATSGGAYFGPRLDLINTTVADNKGTGIVPRPPFLSSPGRGRLSFVNTVVFNNEGGGCGTPPSGFEFQDQGHNVQFPGNDCGGTIQVADPRLDTFYIPYPDSPLRRAGDNAICVGPLVGARDVFGAARPEAGICTIGAVESTIEPHAIRALRHTDRPGPWTALLTFLKGGTPSLPP